jgi:1-acyl-sn-glycerol-3-phosphate acyltransferase
MTSSKNKNPLIETFMKYFVVAAVRIIRVILLAWYRPKVTFIGDTVKSLRIKTPLIIIANHSSMWDPVIMIALFFHDTSIVTAKDQIEDPHFSWALTRDKRVIPCDRFNMDTEWALLAKHELEKGNSVIIFPEGRCRYDGLLNEFKTGFAFLARSTGAPVLAVGIDGIYRFGHHTQIVVSEPEKIERVKGVPSSKHLAEQSEYFRQRVWRLKQRALGIANPETLPIAAETPEEVLE